MIAFKRGSGHPSLLLVRVSPMIDFVGSLPQARIDRRFQTDPQFLKEPQAMQGERLLLFLPLQ